MLPARLVRTTFQYRLTNRWHSKAGEYKIAVYPAEDINDNEALKRFVRAIQQVAPQATGAPMVSLEAGEAVVQAFVQAFFASTNRNCSGSPNIIT